MAFKSLFIAALCLVSASAVAQQTRTLTNSLKLDFPWELVSMDFPAGTFTGDTKVSIGGEDRAVQIEKVDTGGAKIDRAWFIATLKPSTPSTDVVFAPGKAASSLSVSRDGSFITIANGIHTFRIADYAKIDVAGKKLSEIPHWLGGFRIGESPWDGRAWFEGSSVLKSAKTTIIQSGPVFVDVHVDYEFADSATEGVVDAQPLQLGKQTFRYKPGELPRESIPKRTYHYETAIRIVVNDPWIEVVERYRLPNDPTVANFKTHQYQLHFGNRPESIPSGNVPDGQQLTLDTAMWVRWFEWDSFGGNSALNFVPARPRSAQKGRPFAILRARWNQGGAGAQDFFLTSGGDKADPSLPAVGVVAAYPSKWVGPYAATLFANAYDGNRGMIRVPLTDGAGGDADSTQDPTWYGGRAYAICAGPRGLFDSTGKIDSLVRRHTDWTLNAQVNKYILDWKRDPSVSGPNIVTSRQRLAELRTELASNPDAASARIIREAAEQVKQTREKLATLDSKSDAAKALRKVLEGPDARLIALLQSQDVKRPSMPSPMQYLGRRYQADDVNPTAYGTRNLINSPFPNSDLYSNGQPYGNADTAAIAYISSDLDAWPGYRNGWGPGNPNFHTDKYIAALYAAAAMSDHPHAAEWFAFGRANFDDDVRRVVTAPDGVGYECPGYAGYSLGLQTEIARVFVNANAGNPIADNPLFKKTATWHRKLLTPFDVRLGLRHEAPLGDTHRWTSGIGTEGWAKLALFYREADPAFASELMGVFRMLAGDQWKPKSLQAAILQMDLDIAATAPDKLDWSSQYFHGFGAVLRNAFGTPAESFLTLKAGWTAGHYHNDDLSFHYYNRTTPISLDYNCSYHPRGDHAALHNSMTFGVDGEVRHNAREKNVPAMEQLSGSGRVGAFVTTDAADLVVAERSGKSLGLSPVDPDDAEFSRQYPSRGVLPIVHRRLLMMVKHPPGSPLSDYLVVRDETQSDEPQQINLHLLARDATIEGDTVRLVGQWDQDMLVRVVESSDLKIAQRFWAYFDEWAAMPKDIIAQAGETDEAWGKRVSAIASSWKQASVKREETESNSRAWREAIRATNGRAMMPPPGWTGRWLYGESQIWLRMSTKPGTPTTWVLYPFARGSAAPQIERRNDGSVAVRVNGVEEVVSIGSDRAITLTRNGERSVILDTGKLPPLGQIKDAADSVLTKP